VGPWFYHWVYQDAWVPIWPNLAASLIVYVFVYLKLKAMTDLHKEMLAVQDRHHREHMTKLDEIKTDTGSG
jgi:hypothetical protein